MKKSLFLTAFACLFAWQYSLAQTELSVEKIMKDPKWMGTFPSDIQWDEKGQFVYFKYNKLKYKPFFCFCHYRSIT